MIFGDWFDSHDRRIEKLLEKGGQSEQEIMNFNLVGIRRRLNNIEVGVWLIVLILGMHLYRIW